MPWGFGSPTRERVQGRPQAGCGGCQPINLASEGWRQIAPLDQASALQATNALGQHARTDRGNCVPKVGETVLAPAKAQQYSQYPATFDPLE